MNARAAHRHVFMDMTVRFLCALALMLPVGATGGAMSWISSDAEGELFRENVYVGDIHLTEQTNSVTFHVRNAAGGDDAQFELALIVLERIGSE